MTDDFEQEVRAMLQGKAGEMPEAHEPGDIPARAKRRRSMKMASISIAAALVIVVGAAAVVQAADDSSKNDPPVAISHDGQVPSMGCPTVEPGTAPAAAGPRGEPRVVPGLDEETANQLESYSVSGQPHSTVLGPRGWACEQTLDTKTGVTTMTIGKRLADGGFSEERVTLVRDVLGNKATTEQQCRYLSKLAPQWVETQCLPQTMTKVRDDAGRWDDGAVVLERSCATTPRCPQTSRHYDVLTCDVTNDATPCNAIIADYLSRNAGPRSPATTTPTTGLTAITQPWRPTTTSVPDRRKPGGTLTSDGRAGVLRFDVSTELQIETAYGPPDVTHTGNFGVDKSDYKELGYDCVTNEGPARVKVSSTPAQWCTDVFMVNADTKTLVGLRTASSAWHSLLASRIGMSASEVARREHSTFNTTGCLASSVAVPNSGEPVAFSEWHGGPSASDPITSIEMESSKNRVGLLGTC